MSYFTHLVIVLLFIPRCRGCCCKEQQMKLEGAQRVHISAKTECAQTQTDRQTDKSENSISDSFTQFTWRI